MSDNGERRESAGDTVRDGIRSVSGVLGALVETLEQTFSDLRDAGDLSPERARETARSTVRKAQETVEDFRDRFDFVPRKEFEALRTEVEHLRTELDALRGGGAPGASQATEPVEPGPEPDFPIEEG